MALLPASDLNTCVPQFLATQNGVKMRVSFQGAF